MAGKHSGRHHSYAVGVNEKPNFVSKGQSQLFVFIKLNETFFGKGI